jgi:tetratricopeptide (TPR) repeat protein
MSIRRLATRLLCKGLTAVALSAPFVAPADAVAADPPAATRLTSKQVNDIALHGAVWVLNGTVATHKSHGSGWVLDAEAGLIVTNEHVIHGSDEVELFFPVFENGKVVRDFQHYFKNVRPTKAVVIDREYNRDLAILKVDKVPAYMKSLKIAAKGVEDGDEIRTVGGLPKGNEALWGAVRGEVRLVAKRSNAQGWHGQMIVTDMPSNPGNSGGAIVNDQGEVVGVIESGYKGEVALNVTAHVDLSEVKTYLAEARPLVAPADAAAFVKRGQRRLTEGRLDGAAADFSEALKKDRKNTAALVARGRVFLRKNDPATAIGDFDDAIKIEESADAYVARGQAHAKLGKADAAIADLSKAIRIEPAASRGYNERGIVQLDVVKNAAAAAEDFGRAIQAEPTDAVLWSNRAIAHDILGRYTDAIADLTEATRLRPNELNFWDRLGLLHTWKTRNYDAALAAFKEAGKLDPRNSVTAANVADVFLEAKNYEKAVTVFTEAFTLDRERPRLNVTYTAYRRGLAKKGLNDAAGAIDDFTLAIKANPKHARPYLERGLLLKAAGKVAAAKADLEAAAKLDPELAKVAATDEPVVTKDEGEQTGLNPVGTWVFDGVLNGLATYEMTTLSADGTVNAVIRVRGYDGVVREVKDSGTYTVSGNRVTFSMKILGRLDRIGERKGDTMRVTLPDGSSPIDYRLAK